MSLLICSSQQDRYNENEQGNANPSHFTNYLGNAMEIPKHCEVAIQSVKINRQGKYSIREGLNDKGFIYFGQAFTHNATPIVNVVDELNMSLLPYLFEEGDYLLNDYIVMIKRSMDKACAYHPDLACDGIAPVKNTTTGLLESIHIKFGQITNVLDNVLASLSPRPVLSDRTIQQMWGTGFPPGTNSTTDIAVFDDVSAWHGGVAAAPNAGLWDNTDKHMKGNGAAGITVAIFPQACMSWCEGVLTYNVENAKQGNLAGNENGIQWQVGLTRAQSAGDTQTLTYQDGNPRWKRLGDNYGRSLPTNSNWAEGNANWISKNGFAGENTARFMGRDEQMWYDYVVQARKVGGTVRLEVFAAGFNDETKADAVVGDRFVEHKSFNLADTEIQYWLDAGSDMTDALGGAYDLNTDAQGIKNISFTCHADEITIGYTNAADEAKILVQSKANGATKYMPPVCGTKMRLFPKCMVSNENTAAGAGGQKYIKIVSMTGRSLPSIRPYGSGWYEDQSPLYGNLAKVSPSDTHFGENADSSDCRISNIRNQRVITPVKIAGGYLDYAIYMITEQIDPANPADAIFEPSNITREANSIRSLGLQNFPAVLDTTDGTAQGNAGIQWNSVKPSTASSSSYFITCPTLTQTSQNFGKGTPSKILYHLPQFSNSGEDVGSLFFEPGEKTYLRLGNTEKVSLNTLDINIVDKNEKNADDLSGNTVVVLHIRKER